MYVPFVSRYLSIHELLPASKFGRTIVSGYAFAAADDHDESTNETADQFSMITSETLHVLSLISVLTVPSINCSSQ